MELSKAFEMNMDYYGKVEPIRVDIDGFICLTDLNKFFPKKRIRDWETLGTTKEYITTVNKYLNSDDPRSLELLKKKRGRYDGGTYAHELLAFEFATWLSPEFKLKVFVEYTQGTQSKKDWNIKRVLSAFNYKLMSNAVENAHDPAKFYHYSNEAKMINVIVFGLNEKGLRETATESQLDLIAKIESYNATMIDLEMNYQDRKEKLTKLFGSKRLER